MQRGDVTAKAPRLQVPVTVATSVRFSIYKVRGGEHRMTGNRNSPGHQFCWSLGFNYCYVGPSWAG